MFNHVLWKESEMILPVMKVGLPTTNNVNLNLVEEQKRGKREIKVIRYKVTFQLNFC